MGNKNSHTSNNTKSLLNNRCPQKKTNSKELTGPEYQHIRSRLDDVYESQQLDSGDETVSQTVALTKVPRSENVKVQRLRYIIGQYLLDCIGCQEVCININWAKYRPSETLAALIRNGNTELRSVYLYNRHEGDNKSNQQRGGTSTILIEQLQTYVIDKGTDHTDLGRWSWYMLEGSPGHRTLP